MAESKQKTRFGHAALKHFQLDPAYRNLNHGAYGTYPRVVRDQIRRYMDMSEERPDLFIRVTFAKLLDKSREAMADYLNIPSNEVVFVQSVAVAVNTVLRNLIYEPGDVIFYFSTAFGPCINTIKSVVEGTLLQAVEIDSTFPISHDEIVKRFTDAVATARSKGLRPRIGFFDAISSMPAMRYPFERLVEVCREQGMASFVDGAHAIGHIPLDIGKLSPDFFVSMSQKWLYNSRGAAVLHVPIRNQHLIRSHIPTSHVFVPRDKVQPVLANPSQTQSVFVKMFENISVAGNLSYLTVPDAISFRTSVLGGEYGIFTYIQDIAQRGGDLVAEALGTEVLSDVAAGERSLARRIAMVNVRLPIVISDDDSPTEKSQVDWPVIPKPKIAELIPWMGTRLLEDYDTHVPVFLHNSVLWVRLSGQVYLEMDDFVWIAEVLQKLCARIGKF